jgi:tRNA threonylcarbamoyladenosine biosynthesis protein TsaE
MTIVGKKFNFDLDSLENCKLLAEKFSHALPIQSLESKTLHVWFSGDLGSGKTSFIRYFLEALGYQGKVKSPTYNLCEPYSITVGNQMLAIHHFDLYRMNHPLEWDEAGFKDILTSPGINLIEWPEIAEGTLPSPDLLVHLDYVSEFHRKGWLEAKSDLGQAIFAKLES